MTKFCIVRFMEKDAVEIVPTLWMASGDTMCWWPPYSSSLKIVNAVQTIKVPNHETWSKHAMILLGGSKRFGNIAQLLFNYFLF